MTVKMHHPGMPGRVQPVQCTIVVRLADSKHNEVTRNGAAIPRKRAYSMVLRRVGAWVAQKLL
jgi:hypothetical protein